MKSNYPVQDLLSVFGFFLHVALYANHQDPQWLCTISARHQDCDSREDKQRKN